MIFQDPYSSLNPRRRVGAIIGDPFAIHKTATGAERKRKVQELMERVGLNPEHFNRFPAEFSGGQRQRIGVARALALRPKLIICDEPVSALDVSIQAQVLNLLADLQQEYGLTYLFIAHDLEVVRHVSDKVAVMYLGRIGEAAPEDAALRRAAPSLHGRAAVRGPGRRPGRRGRQAADHPHRRRAVADRPAVGLPVPPALPEGAADLRDGRAALLPRRTPRLATATRRAMARRAGPRDRLPLPGCGRRDPRRRRQRGSQHEHHRGRVRGTAAPRRRRIRRRRHRGPQPVAADLAPAARRTRWR